MPPTSSFPSDKREIQEYLQVALLILVDIYSQTFTKEEEKRPNLAIYWHWQRRQNEDVKSGWFSP
jgi:hypothetical protein